MLFNHNLPIWLLVYPWTGVIPTCGHYKNDFNPSPGSASRLSSTTIKDGKWGLLDVNYSDSHFEDADIETLADVNNVEIGIRVKDIDTYDEIANIPVSVDKSETITVD